MILDHWLRRRLVPLLAMDALAGEERARAEAHVASCPKCRDEHDAMRTLMARLAGDPLRTAVREAEVPVALPVLVDLVQERIDRALRAPRAAAAWRWGAGLAAAAMLVVALVLPRLLERGGVPEPVAASPAPSVSADALDRLERNVAREQAARYLGEAQDVLATVAASPRDCDRSEQRVDVEAESRRSRELLARRTLLDVDGAAVASAQPVLDDVEDILREVAAMEACVRFRDVERLQGEIERRNLLMKVRLMQRELLG